MRPQVLVSNLMMLNERPRFEAAIRELGWDPTFAQVDQYLSEQQCLSLAGRFDGWLAGDDRITIAVLEAALPRLKGISKWGTGLDSIDLDAAKRLGIPVLNTPGAFSEAVAEVALGYMLMLSRHLSVVDREVRSGGWPKPRGLGIFGRVCGVIGFGAIGQGIGRRALGCGMSVLAYDPHIPLDRVPHNARMVDVNYLIENSDVVCLACSLTSENHHLIDERRFSQMKPDSLLVNVGRGPLVSESALIGALSKGLIAGAALDVYEVEPLPMQSELRNFPNVILGSHNANNLDSAVEFVHQNTLKNMVGILGS